MRDSTLSWGCWMPGTRFPCKNGEAVTVLSLGPLGAAPKTPPSPGKPSRGGTEVVSSVSTYIQQGDPQMACSYTAWSWVTKDAGPEQPGDGFTLSQPCIPGGSCRSQGRTAPTLLLHVLDRTSGSSHCLWSDWMLIFM